jgi:hypothetical protein
MFHLGFGINGFVYYLHFSVSHFHRPKLLQQGFNDA